MKKTIHVKRRISVLLGLCALIVALIAGRLFYLQILNPEYRQKMLELTRKTIELFPTRGSITDRDGYTLAYDENAYVLYLFPEEIEDKEALRQQIMEILPADQETVDTWLNGEGTITADIDISQEQADALMAIEARGLSVITQNQRRYAESLSAGSLIGFTDQDHRGAVGLEAYYEDLLKGTPGKMRLFSYSGGIPVPYEQEVQYPKKEGYSLSLTIDSALQEIVVEKGRNDKNAYRTGTTII
jgi:cell division protein FtsI/penicillin-binding protein 2